jgi:nucleotide-binding universal stress UspA family protein
MIKSILVPVDGSDNSRVAVEHAIYFAQLFNAELCGLNVVDIRSLEGPFLSDISASLGFAPFQNYLPKFQEILEERSDLILNNIEEMVVSSNIKFRKKRLSGVVSTLISEEAKMFDMVVIAQRGEHAQWSSGLLGSTTESVVRKTPRPVLVTTNTFRKIKNVTVAYDGAVESSNALKASLEMFIDDAFNINVVIVTDDIEKKEKLTSEVNEFASPYNKDVNIAVLSGDSGKAIIDYLEDNSSDIIVMGVFSHSRLHDIILGSTAAYILRKSEIPVLLNR